MRFASMISAVALGVAMTSPALAQQAGPEAIGAVQSVEGEVLVARGAKTETLKEGDQIFSGDRIVTRADGRIELSANDCSQTLEAVQSIVVDAEFCSKAPLQLASNDPLGQTPPSAGGPGVGAVAGGGALLAAAVLAAASNDDDNGPSTPVSP